MARPIEEPAYKPTTARDLAHVERGRRAFATFVRSGKPRALVDFPLDTDAPWTAFPYARDVLLPQLCRENHVGVDAITSECTRLMSVIYTIHLTTGQLLSIAV